MRKRNLCSFKSAMYDMERLFMLACAAHGEQAEGSNSAKDHAHITGVEMARHVLATHANEIPLDFAYAGDGLGGYGKYYRDSMFSLGLAEHEPEDEYERPTDLGVAISDTFDALASGLEIASHCERGSIARDELHKIGEKICLCRIKYNKREAEQMTRVLFGLPVGDEYEIQSGHNPGARPKSLAFMLYAINQSGLNGHTLDNRDFADAIHLGCTSDTASVTRVWPLLQLRDVSEMWGVVAAGAHRNIAFAVEVMLQSLLKFMYVNQEYAHDRNSHGMDHMDTAASGQATPDGFITHILDGLDDGLDRALQDACGRTGVAGTPHTMRGMMRPLRSDRAPEGGFNYHNYNEKDITEISRMLDSNSTSAPDPAAPEFGIVRALQKAAVHDAARTDMHLAAANCTILIAVTAMRLYWRIRDGSQDDPCIKWWEQRNAGLDGTLGIALDAADAIKCDAGVGEFVRMLVQKHVVRRASEVWAERLRAGIVSRRWLYGSNGCASRICQDTAFDPAYGYNMRFDSVLSIFEDLGLVQAPAKDDTLQCTKRGRRVLGYVLGKI